MRILHTADWHLGKNIEGQSRLKEQKAFLEDFVRIAREEQADLVIIAGDVYDSVNPPAEAEKLFYHTLKQVTEGGKRLVLVIAGNHDSPDRLVAAGPLAMEHGILMAGLPKTVIPEGVYGKHRVTASGEGYVEVEIGGERAVILLLPYPSEKRLGEVIYREMEEGQERAASYGERVGLFFSRLEKHLGQMKKYQATIDYLTQENEGLREKVNSEKSIQKQMEVLMLKKENEQLRRFVNSIPPEVRQALKEQQRGTTYKKKFER